jgi:hypothetical protein
MIIRRSLRPFFAIVALTIALAVRAQTARTPPADFAPGQMWSIKSASPTLARVIIGRIELWDDKVAVHVSVVDVPIPSGAPGADGVISIDHMPFDESALAASVNQLLAIGVRSAPGFENGYGQWKSGLFTVVNPGRVRPRTWPAMWRRTKS